jgi:predicted RND superfamily exporter protein
MDTREDAGSRLFIAMASRPMIVIGAAVLITALLAIPFLTMAPTTSASQEPGGPVFDARDAVEEQFVSAVFTVPIIVEARDGNLLSRGELIELRDNTAALRADPDLGPSLLGFFDEHTRTDVVGVRTIADVVDEALPGGLEAATDEEVAAAADAVIDRLGHRSDVLGLSGETTFDQENGHWVAPALVTQVVADNDALGFANTGVTLGTDTAPEEYARQIVAAVSGDQATLQVWGVAIDVNLTSQEQGEAAGPFIGFTILAVLIIVGLVFRSYWSIAVTGAALGALIVWLYGISNLIGLEDDLILSLIVPIAMISFGVDFTFHALGRYQEERRLGDVPRRAFTIGMSAVIAALVLALLSDTAAFLANVSSGIESIIQFGVATSIALVAAFLLLGIVTPLAIATIEQRTGTAPKSRARTLGRAGAQVAAGLLAMTTVLLMVYIEPAIGVVALAIYVLAAITAPALLAKRRPVDTTPLPGGVGRVGRRLGSVVAAIAARRRLVLPLAFGVTAAAAFLAIQVPTEFDVKDFFAEDTDFVVALDKVDQHIGDRGGEPATIYVNADLSDPETVDRLRAFRADLQALEADSLARDENGGTRVLGSVLDVIEDAVSARFTTRAIEATSGAPLTDNDRNGIPDQAAQLAAIYAFTSRAGITADGERFIQTPNDVNQNLWQDDDGERYATTFTIQLRDTRRQESVVAAREALEPLVTELRTDLGSSDAEAVVELTGGPIVRQESLEAISRALQISLPIAVVLCFVIAAAFMRSIRYGLVSIVPILMTVSLLYAFMELAGYSINVVTATIGAVSIGIGIDFAIHYAMRYREELGLAGNRHTAVRRAGEGTGVALLSSAASSAVGFFILSFAPMPMFAVYGLLTAVMITMAATATLLVLPSLLVTVTKDRAPQDPEPEAHLVVA